MGRDRTKRSLREAALLARDDVSPLDLWRGLAAGCWTVVDRFDACGCRYFVARSTGRERLSAREQQVVRWAATGESNKVIAYELALSPGAVSSYLSTALGKLGLPCRTDLVALSAMALAAERRAK